MSLVFFFQAEDGIRDHAQSRGLGDVYKRQEYMGKKTLIMELIYILTLYISAAACFIYLLFCVDPNQKGVLPYLHRLVFDRFPETIRQGSSDVICQILIRKVIGKIFGNRGVQLIESIANYICYKNHPLIQVHPNPYSLTSQPIKDFFGFYQQFPTKSVGIIHVFIGSAGYLACLFIFYKACSTDPGIVTKKNVQEYLKVYDYCQFNKQEIFLLKIQETI
eukprot:TRINITY_DN4783_c0_g1_i5.p1 TRINITY_DN4783_c0_g1~~TRINITY_DN4783_c0_g1_i5.p1  ORF type:complete len:220 (+),score=38.50 TRINITY_DN4783_c0_g1_i5:23-682(+)